MDHTSAKSVGPAETSWLVESFAQNGPLQKLALAAAALVVGIFGIAGVGRGDAMPGFDLYVLWAAGSAWWAGTNPYAATQLSAAIGAIEAPREFAYPPHIAPLCMALASAPFSVARALVVLLNLASLVAIAELCGRMLRQAQPKQYSLWPIAILLSMPFTSHVVFIGQTPLIVMAGAIGSIWFAGRNRPMAAGALLAIASIKPQLSLLVVLWLLCRREIRTLLVAACIGVVAIAIPMAITGPYELVVSWLDAIGSYRANAANQPGFSHMFGLSSFLAVIGVRIPALELLTFVGFGLVWRARKQISDLEIVALLFVISLLFLPAHDPDLVALAPLVYAFSCLPEDSPRTRWTGLFLLAVLFVPQRLIRPLGLPILEQFRVPIVAAGLGLWVVAKARAGGPDPRGQ